MVIIAFKADKVCIGRRRFDVMMFKRLHNMRTYKKGEHRKTRHRDELVKVNIRHTRDEKQT